MAGGNKKSVVVRAPVLEVNISPLGFHHYGRQFLEASRSASSTETFAPVPLYLVCHAMELLLKAFLLGKGISKKELKDTYRHDLVSLLNAALTHELSSLVQVCQQEREELEKANAYYKEKAFEYFFVIRALKGYRDLPNLAILDAFAERLSGELEQFCLRA